MRAFEALALIPPTMGPEGRGGVAAALLTRPLTFADHWNEPDVRGVLYAAQGRVCGFCGCYLPRNDRGDVEHFRPKSASRGAPPNGGYWWLAYVMSNYLLSCSVCNRTHKRTKFPLVDEGTRVMFETRDAVGDEAVVLFHPAVEGVEEWIEIDLATGMIDPAAGLSAADRERVVEVRGFFKWNQDSRLVLERRQTIQDVILRLERGLDAEVKVMASRFWRHSLAVLAVLRRTNRLELVPTREEEVMMLGLEVGAELEIELATGQRDAAAESMWVLRSLWEQAGADLKGWLEARWEVLGVRSEILALTFWAG